MNIVENWKKISAEITKIRRDGLEKNLADKFIPKNLALEALGNPLMWRFLPRKWENGLVVKGVWIARLPLRVKNSTLFELFSEGYRLATLREYFLCNAPYNRDGFLKTSEGFIYTYPYPFGFSIKTYSRFFAETGFAWSGIRTGPGMDAVWCDVWDDTTKKTTRVGASEGIVDKDLLENFSNYVGKADQVNLINPTTEREVFGEGGNYMTPSAAGYSYDLEAMQNEGYLIAMDATPEEVAAMQPLIQNLYIRLSDDMGNALFSKIWDEDGVLLIAFAGGGRCSICNRMKKTTINTVGETNSKFGLKTIFYPEYQDWTEKKYYEVLG